MISTLYFTKNLNLILHYTKSVSLYPNKHVESVQSATQHTSWLGQDDVGQIFLAGTHRS